MNSLCPFLVTFGTLSFPVAELTGVIGAGFTPAPPTSPRGEVGASVQAARRADVYSVRRRQLLMPLRQSLSTETGRTVPRGQR